MTAIKTLCTVCQNPLLLEWPEEMSFAGVICTAKEYLSSALRSQTVYVTCDSCLAKMPDVNLCDLMCAETGGEK